MRKIEIIDSASEIKRILDKFSAILPSLSAGENYRSDMAKKFSANGVFITYRDNSEEIGGFAAFYCNDKINRIGYLSMIAVLPNMRKNGVGQSILCFVEKYSLQNGMYVIKLEVKKSNNTAQRFYMKNGYRIMTEASDDSLYLVKNIKNENL